MDDFMAFREQLSSPVE